MILSQLSLKHFRNYSEQAFTFSPEVTTVVGPNTAGKTNLMEAIYLLATGKSFKAEKDTHMIRLREDIARVIGTGRIDEEELVLEVVIAHGVPMGNGRPFQKRYTVNGVPRRRIDFAGRLPAVLFTPSDLELIIAGPSHRRNFLDDILEQIDTDYRHAVTNFTRALRQRNALLEHARETGRRNIEQFSYWDDLLITHGQTVTAKREAFIDYINTSAKTAIDFTCHYDKSVISAERLAQYSDGEIGAGVTLVGPQRDDFQVFIGKDVKAYKDVRMFGSRGQQRLVVLQLKLLQLAFMEAALGRKPLLLLDDIFSELDSGHIALVHQIIRQQQTLITTTHEEFITNAKEMSQKVISLVEKE